ncbi:methyltransferase domain-containing protein [Methylobacterium sp. J-068]|uniref:methyltransferase domain-containing protein n=1 Tax=Methylobacterium sp. J-068 TaxID=2836649 RepID=UPI001FBB4AA6|nr:methyltransferase domain-containing protein [Methylobacterium sp. J-068]MCJ2034838.1 methyltransferase domain-containing protein [Methylobacterium sp. J-068]
MQSWKQAVARAFDAAEGYDGAAAIQAEVAARLAERIAGASRAAAPRILEVGCGTGLLTAALARQRGRGILVASDIAPAMIQRCRARLTGAANLHVTVMDAERPCLAPGFDLIASSLAAQWFEDLPGTLARLSALLAPGGLMAVATLAEGTFAEWRAAHAALGLEAATPRYPALAELAGLSLPGCTLAVSGEPVIEVHADGRAFLGALRAIGAGTPGTRDILSAGALRRVLRLFEAGGARVTYEVATLLIRRREQG